ncbi:hypothetical protein LSS_00235 [Leptospira santarosai serovar Shermani str. LT 821]|uniref:Uncharacterized protein n=1 Tax=Leptospira santarosai serovar Shermani str. LT 821 TaxID=758847 RepID=K8Y534_9LEPT|nr:hypothetical protein LSS_00235 [Leptospira santarosai serovar Shermani str. LT 821]
MEKLHPFKDRFENAIEIPKNMPQTFLFYLETKYQNRKHRSKIKKFEKENL